jgi:predicted site-specific integrase-resolvase
MLTVQQAATQVNRSRQTIENWITEGLLDVAVIRNENGRVIRRYLNETELLTVFRKKLNPTAYKEHG